MFAPLNGIIKCFDIHQRNNFGYITPDKRRKDGKDYYFQISSATKFFELTVGEVEMRFGSTLDIRPKRGDRVVFIGGEYKTGPVVEMWNTELEWIRVKALIARRPWKECFNSRIIEQNPDTNTKTIVWEGPKALLLELLQIGNPDFLKNSNDWYQKFWCEELRVEGWKKIPNPLTPELELKEKGFHITEAQREILDNSRLKINTERRNLLF
jgi:hypothetical protein